LSDVDRLSKAAAALRAPAVTGESLEIEADARRRAFDADEAWARSRAPSSTRKGDKIVISHRHLIRDNPKN
jgi:hypothetical protein